MCHNALMQLGHKCASLRRPASSSQSCTKRHGKAVLTKKIKAKNEGESRGQFLTSINFQLMNNPDAGAMRTGQNYPFHERYPCQLFISYHPLHSLPSLTLFRSITLCFFCSLLFSRGRAPSEWRACGQLPGGTSGMPAPPSWGKKKSSWHSAGSTGSTRVGQWVRRRGRGRKNIRERGEVGGSERYRDPEHAERVAPAAFS